VFIGIGWSGLFLKFLIFKTNFPTNYYGNFHIALIRVLANCQKLSSRTVKAIVVVRHLLLAIFLSSPKSLFSSEFGRRMSNSLKLTASVLIDNLWLSRRMQGNDVCFLLYFD
jgi:hypothetical protein